jgi:hypothetical protein
MGLARVAFPRLNGGGQDCPPHTRAPRHAFHIDGTQNPT